MFRVTTVVVSKISPVVTLETPCITIKVKEFYFNNIYILLNLICNFTTFISNSKALRSFKKIENESIEVSDLFFLRNLRIIIILLNP